MQVIPRVMFYGVKVVGWLGEFLTLDLNLAPSTQSVKLHCLRGLLIVFTKETIYAQAPEAIVTIYDESVRFATLYSFTSYEYYNSYIA